MTLARAGAVTLAVLLGPAGALAQGADTVNIGILVDELQGELNPLLDTLVAEIAAVVGGDAVVRFAQGDMLENGFDLARARETYQVHVDGSVDIILAFGPVIGTALAERTDFPKPTIVFGSVNAEMVDLPTDRSTSGIDNFTYVLTSQSYSRDLSTFKDLVDFQRLGVVASEPYPRLLPIGAV